MTKIPIVLSTNKDYAPYCATTIASILTNSKKEIDLSFHVLTSDLSEKIKNKFQELKKIKRCSINFITVAKNSFENCPILHHFSIETYFRFRLASLLPSIDKLIYIDSDIIMLGDIAQLFNIDINNYHAGMVLNTRTKFNLTPHIQQLGLMPNKNYFNTGIMLVNLKKWKKENLESEFFKWTEKNKKKIEWVDQDVMNVILSGFIKELPEKYNVQLTYYKNNELLSNLTDEIHAIHYCGQTKPWDNKGMFLSKYFWKYAEISPFYKEIKHNLISLQNYSSFKSKQKNDELLSCLISGKDILAVGFNRDLVKKLNINRFRVECVNDLTQFKNKLYDTLIVNKNDIADKEIIPKEISLLRNGGRVILAMHKNEKFKSFINAIKKNKNYKLIIDYISSDGYLITFFVKKLQKKKDKPIVDILMSTYNREKYIKKAIISILYQTHSNWRLYVINDGGSDIGHLIKEFNDDRIIYINEKHRGKSHALNVGIKKGKGKYIAYLDDDDIIYPSHLESLVCSLENNSGFGFAFNDTYEVKLKNNLELNRKIENRQKITPDMLLTKNYINHKCLIHRRDLIQKVGYYDESLKILVDWDYIRKLACCTKYIQNYIVSSEHYLRVDNNNKPSSQMTGLWHKDVNAVEKSIKKIADNTKKVLCNPEIFKPALIRSIKEEGYMNYVSALRYNDVISNCNNKIKNRDIDIENKNIEIKEKNIEIKEKNIEIKEINTLITSQSEALHILNKLNNTILGKINWAIHNPIKFIVKYLKKINWAIYHPLKFIKKHIFNRLKIILHKAIAIIKKIKWGICNPIKLFRKYSAKIQYLLGEQLFHFKKEGLLKSITRTINYIKYGKGVHDGIIQSSGDRIKTYNEKTKNFQKYLSEEGHKDIKKTINSFDYKPKISIIVPVYNVSREWLEKCINSVINQYYTNWELCLHDDASTKKETLDCLKLFEKKDNRIKISYSKNNRNISAASNAALKLATGEFIGLLDNDDEITPNALYEVVKVLNKNKELDLFYSDEDKIDMRGNYSEPHFKSDYNPDLLLSQNYICHFTVIRHSLIKNIGAFRTGYEGCQDFDLFLRVVENTKNIYHIPKVLYHWRKIPGSTAEIFNSKNYAWERGRMAVNNAIVRRKIDGKVELGEFPGSYHVVRKTKNAPLVSIIIPFKDHPSLLDYSVGSVLKKTTYKNFELIGVSNNSKKSKTFKKMRYYEKLDPRVRFYEYNIPFNYSKINNFAANKCNGEYIVLMNNDIKVVTPDWIEQLLQHAQRNEIGAVGAKLYYPDDTIQHAGVVMGVGGIAGHSHKYFKHNSLGYFGRLKLTQNISAVTAALLMVRKNAFYQIGGLDEKLQVAFNDVDFCLRLREKGYLNVFTPHCEMYHYESKSRGKEDSEEKIRRFQGEIAYFKKKHRDLFLKTYYDPYYNPNLTTTHENFSISKAYLKNK